MRMVYCTFSVIGFHQFDNAPEDVKYLRDNHRHEFKFKVALEVNHDNREIEFQALKRFCMISVYRMVPYATYTLECNELQFGSMSCEMIADKLMHELILHDIYGKYPDDELGDGKERQIMIEVSEDGECGGFVSRF